ncbi:SDR family oxidoreductase [Halocalculus aciditolerans]|uniref:Short-chain dehydrogenase n=1 Tax=Halocalculus aciditolerans TaxID=1383812 RepID=A0A830FE23_9EURY|nr:SDR family oxidoreductase [Halocalculus aciditolerans]GGL65946.1 short-chain dehydrogenase [Halocalculus aciditolerans]
MTDLLTSKTCIVTGAGHGIGRATAIELGSLGANVVVNDLGSDVHGEGTSQEPAEETVAAVEDAGGTAIAHFGDVTDLDYTERLIADTVDEFGRVDGVANFAGILRDALAENMTGDEWDAVINVHLRGHFSLLRNAAAHWADSAPDGGFETSRSFVALTSRSALGNVGQVNYSTAKAGILGMIRTTSTELDRYNVRVNAVMPTAYTRMIEDIPEEKQPFTREDMPPERVASMIGYLLSDAADGITGSTLRVAGEQVGVVSHPELVRSGYRDGGWSAEDLADGFTDDVAEGVDLDNSGGAF